MKPLTEYSWLFLDLNSYFASVEQQMHPELRGKPIAVVPMMTDYTCAIAASYEAKAYGIRTGTNIGEAKKMCPQLRCILARHNHYVEYHHKIVDEFVRHTPLNKIWSVDEMSSCLPPNKRAPEAAQAVATRIREGIWKNIGEYINCSIGIASNSYLAKVATDMKKPNGLVVLDQKNLKDKLFKLDLIDLPGINTSMESRLRKAGIATVEQLWGISPKHARMIWGSVGGERFWYNLHGYHIPDQETNPSMIGHSHILDPELRNPDKARQVARRLTVKAASRLRRKEYFATRFYLSARMDDTHKWSGEMQLQPAQDTFTFLQHMEEMWAIMMDETRPYKIRKLSVTMHGLKKSEEISLDFFQTETKQTRRNEALSLAMDKLNEKYGAETLQLGVSPQTRAGYLGTKIAFSRVPEMAEFNE